MRTLTRSASSPQPPVGRVRTRPAEAATAFSADLLGGPDAICTLDLLGGPDTNGHLDVLGEPDALGRPDLLGGREASARPDLLGGPDAPARGDLLGGPNAPLAAPRPLRAATAARSASVAEAA